MSYTVIYNANELVTGPANSAETDAAGTTPNGSGGPPDGPVLSVLPDAAVVLEDGEVAAVGSSDELTREYPIDNADEALDASGKCVLPGFVDPHTHAVFAGDRSDEFEAKLRGTSYQEILADGGGILRTVRAVREASEDELTDSLLERLDTMLAAGTTTLEIKSGYGLDTETELKLLAAIGRADERHPIDIVATFMGAHAVPDDTDAEEYTTSVIEDQFPAVEQQGVAEFCDVFCEADVFSANQSREILEAGTDHGLTPKLHIDEFENLGGSKVAAAVSAASADHLLQSTPDDIDTLLEADVTPVLLPGTAFGLGGEYPDLEPIASETPFRHSGAISIRTATQNDRASRRRLPASEWD